MAEASDCRVVGPVRESAAQAVLLRARRRRLLLALCISVAIGTVLSCGRTAAPAAIPDTPAGRAFRDWLDAYNAGDSARLEAYVRRYEPAMSVHTQLVFREQTGPWYRRSFEWLGGDSRIPILRR